MATIKGQHLRLRIGDDSVASALSCTLHCAAQVQDSSTKDSDDGWVENEVVGLNWDVSTDQLVCEEDPTGGVAWSTSEFMGAMEDKDVLDVTLETTDTSDHNRSSDVKILTGKAVITDFQITAQNRQNSTASIQLTGVSDLHFVEDEDEQSENIHDADEHPGNAELSSEP